MVFKSWEESKAYVDDIQEDFEQLWNKQDDDLEILDFPKVLKDKFEVMRKPELDPFFTKEEISEEEEEYDTHVDIPDKGIPHVPSGSWDASL